MNRAVPASIIVHLAMLLLVVFFGAWVDRPVLTPRRTINVQITTMPEIRVEDPVRSEEPEPAAEEAPVVATPAPEIVEAAPEPKPVPEKPEETVVVEPEPEPVVEKPKPVVEKPKPVEAKPAEPTSEPVATAAEAVPDISSVTSTDREVPVQFQYYLKILQGNISRQWQPKRVGMRESSSRYCVIHFYVERDGRISRESVARTSGIDLFDKEALGAVRRAGRMPPLPAGITGSSLGVNFSFTLKSGT